MFRFLAFTLVLAATSALAAEDIPHLDIQSTCKAAVPLVPQDRSPQENCMRDETDARGELDKKWTSFPAALRARCVEETNIGGYPSYVEVLTCLQIATGNAAQAPSEKTYSRPRR
ncbi:hypothetical protein [Microvirga sp. 2TAF3]|uniref:hypothetical protein n=1 Tax=Microvirga sp. 2TAF3 TaxID=3233014 RepID=UPI003F95447A